MVVLARELCYSVTHADSRAPLFVLSLPKQECDFDKLLPEIIAIIDAGTRRNDTGSSDNVEYQLLIFCAGKHRPSWPWLLQNYTKMDAKYKKGLQKLYLVHEKSWIRVCMQLLENVVSPKFARKVRHVRDLAKLQQILGSTMKNISIPEEARKYDETLMRDDKHSKKRRQRTAKPSEARPDATCRDEARTSEKCRLSPPAVPPARSLSRSQSPVKSMSRTSDIAAPDIPPRRSSSNVMDAASRVSKVSKSKNPTEPLIIFEDPIDEDVAAAESAASNLEAVLKYSEYAVSPEKSLGQRSSSAPSITQSHQPRLPGTLKSAQVKNGPPNTLRRAISGPLTPSSSLKQNYLPPLNQNVAPPKLLIHGKQYSVKTKNVTPGVGVGKVGGLKALFEQKALVAQSMA